MKLATLRGVLRQCLSRSIPDLTVEPARRLVETVARQTEASLDPLTLLGVGELFQRRELGVEVDVPLLLLLLAGTVAGAWIGPRISRHLRERWLEGILGLVLLLIGVRYLGGF